MDLLTMTVSEVIASAVKESEVETGWGRISARQRLAVLKDVRNGIAKYADQLAAIEARESGKFLENSIEEVSSCIVLWDYAITLLANEIDFGLRASRFGENRFSSIVSRPVGPVLMITPFNYPLVVLSERLPFALAAGCPVVVKPSEVTPSSARRLCEIARECGLPSGAMQVVEGDGEFGSRLVADRRFSMISFTGSTDVAQKISKAIDHRQTRTSFELGGKNSFIVSRSADLLEAAESAAFASTVNGGQACIAPSRLIVHQVIQEEFKKYLLDSLVTLVETNFQRYGVPIQQPPTTKHASRALELLKSIQFNPGWKQILDIEQSFPHCDLNQFVYPHVFETSDQACPLFNEEFFAPYLALITFTSVEQAINLANSGSYGLAAYFWTNSDDELAKFVSTVRAGRQWHNCDMRDSNPGIPIGGFGLSGIGRELGPDALNWYRQPIGLISTKNQAGAE